MMSPNAVFEGNLKQKCQTFCCVVDQTSLYLSYMLQTLPALSCFVKQMRTE